LPSPKIKFVTKVHQLEPLKVSYLEVPAPIVKKLGGITKHRLLCTANKSFTWQCGLVALGHGKGYITLNKKIMKELSIKTGDEVNVALAIDKSKYGMEMPVELKELLHQDPEASKRFDGLVAGKQRYIIYYVKQVKSSQLRIERVVMLMENLKKLPKGKETFKGLFEVSGGKI
jgi:hypothetical protein